MSLRPSCLVPLLSLFGVLVFCQTPARARIGETMDECVERYGPSYGSLPSICGREGELCYLFKRTIDSGGKIKTILMKIEFIEGKAAYLRISSPAISDDDAKDLVGKSGGKSTWQSPQSITDRSYYVTDDKQREACIYRLGEVRVVEIFSAAMTDFLNAYRLATLANPPAKLPSRNVTNELNEPAKSQTDGKSSPGGGGIKGF